MAHRLVRRFRSSGALIARVSGVSPSIRMLGALAIMSLLTVASLKAQDRPASPGAPQGPVPTSPPSAPAVARPMTDSPNQTSPPQAIQFVQRIFRAAVGADQPTPPRAIQLAELETLNTVVVGNLAPRRFQFTIDPKTPLKDLLPIPPDTKNPTVLVTDRDLTHVPEVQFQMPLTKIPNEEALKKTAHTIAKINHLNEKKTDGFLEALRGDRPDLTGLPFAMGDVCRTKGDRSKQFAIEVNRVRAALQSGGQNFQAFGQINSTFTVPQANTPMALPAVSRSGGASLVPAPTPAEAPSSGPQVPPPPLGTSPPSAPAIAPQPAPSTSGGPPTPAAGGGSPAIPGSPQPPPALVVDNSDGTVQAFFSGITLGSPATPEKFWEQYLTACANCDKSSSRTDKCHQELVTLTRIAALMQVLAPESPGIRLALVKYLAGISHAEATRALAKLAIFSAEDSVRQPAIDALKVRRERDYTEILLAGLRYPWPDVAKRSADALVKLERTDLVPQLVDLLDEPDPRAPVVHVVNNKRVQEVHELVRVNHHRSCLLCHAPANTGTVAGDTLTAAVPTPGDPLPSPGQGYQNSIPDVLVRIDVTYLRQDFSMFQAVADSNPWPEMQRFDFLVRTRTVSDKEADAYREKLSCKEPGVLSPYHRAALAALRELTGRDTAPTADAWRELLKLPARAKGPATSMRTAMAR